MNANRIRYITVTNHGRDFTATIGIYKGDDHQEFTTHFFWSLNAEQAARLHAIQQLYAKHNLGG